MTKLEAVNEILEAVGDPEVTALDTGGTSDEGVAEKILDRHVQRILESGPGVQIGRDLFVNGWWANVEWDFDAKFASVSLTGTISSGAFTQGERVVQASTNAEGIITDAYSSSDTTFVICPFDGSADFDGSNNITGDDSGTSTATVTAVSNPTSGVIQLWNKWLEVRPYSNASPISRNIVERDGRLYDLDDRTETFDDDVQVAVARLLDFTELPSLLQVYAVKSAARKFARFNKRSGIDERLAQDEEIEAKVAAESEHRIQSPVNVLETSEMWRVRGKRNRNLIGEGEWHGA